MMKFGKIERIPGGVRMIGRILVLAALQVTSVAALAAGLAVHGEAKYKDGFTHFDYANANAPKGGAFVMHEQGTFDTLNPFLQKGVAATYLGSLVFQELGTKPLDEPFSVYPSLAESYEVAPDKLSMIIRLDKAAKFADGKPVTGADVAFSFKLLTTHAEAAPFYKYYWADIKEVTAVDQHTVKMVFAKENNELPLIATELPVLPKHVYEKGDWAKDFSDKAVGSGPYVVKDFKKDVYITFKRNPDFWGKDRPVFKGRYNFDEITVKYYKDDGVAVEAFKKGDFDFFPGNHSKIWATVLVGERFETLKWIRKEKWPHRNNQGTQGFLANLRNPLFQDIRVRKALALAFDFEWSNKNLFYGLYKPNESYFQNSPLQAKGLPTPEELAILEPLKADLEPEVFSKEMGWLGKGLDIKDRLRLAMQLLKEAGYTVKDGVATGPAGKLEFKFLTSSPSFNRILEPYFQNLRKLGILVSLEEKEESLYVKRVETRDFAMMVRTIGQSESPGNEQREFWTSKAADENFSRNYGGVKNKAIDALVDKVIYAKTRPELELATRCLDRALYHMHLLVHNWHAPEHKVAFWDKLGWPEKLPDYYGLGQIIEYMWVDAAKEKKLAEAKAAGKPLL
jgi:microcin C transport system substrate-binding protein